MYEQSQSSSHVSSNVAVHPVSEGVAAGPRPTTVQAFIDSFDPPAASVNQSVTIRGGSFDSGSRVFFGGIEAGNVDRTGVPNTLRAVVPPKAKSGPIQVDLALSSASFRVLPTFASNAPTSGTPLVTTVVIAGTGFNDKPITVSFTGPNGPGTVPATVTGGDELTIGVTVPDGTVSGPLKVQTAGGTISGGTFMPLPQAPQIKNKNGFSPASGPVGTQVMILAKPGTQFQSITEVAFKGPGIPKRVPATYSVVERKTAILAIVPSGAVTGTIRVVNASGSDTTSADFVVTPA